MPVVQAPGSRMVRRSWVGPVSDRQRDDAWERVMGTDTCMCRGLEVGLRRVGLGNLDSNCCLQEAEMRECT